MIVKGVCRLACGKVGVTEGRKGVGGGGAGVCAARGCGRRRSACCPRAGPMGEPGAAAAAATAREADAARRCQTGGTAPVCARAVRAQTARVRGVDGASCVWRRLARAKAPAGLAGSAAGSSAEARPEVAERDSEPGARGICRRDRDGRIPGEGATMYYPCDAGRRRAVGVSVSHLREGPHGLLIVSAVDTRHKRTVSVSVTVTVTVTVSSVDT